MAALVASGQRYTAFTHSHEHISWADDAIPRKLTRKLEVEHIILRNGVRSPEALERFDRHSYGQCHQNRQFFEYDHYSRLGDRAQWTMLPGGCFEVGRCYFWPQLPATLPSDADDATDVIIEALEPGAPERVRTGLREWLTMPAADTTDWRDRFYIEQRLGGWLATTEQATDANTIPKLHIANSRYVYDLMLQVDAKDRRTGRIQHEAIELLAPELLKFPVNPSPPRYANLMQKVRRKVKEKMRRRAR